jgi:DNA-binding HxlR family transcriptional regulator
VAESGDGFNVETLDEVIHGRLRLGVMAYLSTAGMADFNTLKAKVCATDGNLSAHLRKLEEAGYIRIAKRFHDRKPLTEAILTPVGRQAFVRYLDAIGRLIDQG